MRDISWIKPGLRVMLPSRWLHCDHTGTVARKHWRPFEWVVHFDDTGEEGVCNAAKLTRLYPKDDPRNSDDEACTFFRELKR